MEFNVQHQHILALGVTLTMKKCNIFKFTVSSEHWEVSVHHLMLTKPRVKIFLKKSKLLAAFYTNCVNCPLVDLPDDVKVIEVLAPIELHLLRGNTNRIYNNLEKYLQPMDSTLSANQWDQSLGFQRPKLHGGQFKGGECSKLLKKIHVRKINKIFETDKR